MNDNENISTQSSNQQTDKFFNMSRMRRIIANMKAYIDTRLKEKADSTEIEDALKIDEYL